MKFWIFWGFDALVALVVLYFFFIGLADSSVSSFNMGLWLGIVLVVGCVMIGSIMVRSRGRTGGAIGVLLILGLPGLIFALFFIILIIANPRWN